MKTLFFSLALVSCLSINAQIKMSTLFFWATTTTDYESFQEAAKLLGFNHERDNYMTNGQNQSFYIKGEDYIVYGHPNEQCRPYFRLITESRDNFIVLTKELEEIDYKKRDTICLTGGVLKQYVDNLGHIIYLEEHMGVNGLCETYFKFTIHFPL
jgi:hypothetical protein